MNALINVALGSLKTDASAREALAPGKYPVDATVRVVGSLSVGVDYDTVPTVSLPVKEILALFVAHAGITREATMSLLRRCVEQAIADEGKSAGEIAERVAAVDAYLEVIKKEILEQLPRVPRKGAVKAKLEVEILEAAELAAA